jgi:lipoate-protein ligase A
VSAVDPTLRPAPNGVLPLWRLIDLGRCPPMRAHAFAESVAESVAAGDVANTLLIARPAAPYISLGFHQSLVEEIDPGFLERRPVPLLRRVEGGGTTWLDPDQWFYQLVYRDEGGGPGGPPDLARFLAAPVRAARELGLPAELRPPSDLVVGDRKISGNAGGDWADVHLLVGGFLGRADTASMADLLRLPHPGVRPLLRELLDARITSWEVEAGGLPAWETVRDRLVRAFQALGLFRVRKDAPTAREESRFRSETVPRHQGAEWRELPPVAKASTLLRRRIRIAGPHGLVVVGEEGSERLFVGVVEGETVRVGYRLEASPASRPLRLGQDAPELGALRGAVRGAGGFG